MLCSVLLCHYCYHRGEHPNGEAHQEDINVSTSAVLFDELNNRSHNRYFFTKVIILSDFHYLCTIVEVLLY